MASTDYMKELQRLEEVFSFGFISDEEYQSRKRSLLEAAGLYAADVRQTVGFEPALPLLVNKQELANIVVCFLLDGSEKYAQMTERAIRSFQRTTPGVAVGLLCPEHLDISNFLSKVERPELIVRRNTETHFTNWNPTQHKMDIIKFSDQFSTIFWLDSDTITMQDMRPFLLEFHRSPKLYALVKDRVNYYDEFRNSWPGNKENLFIAQACMMGFKREAMPALFSEWKRIWYEWIVPTPFSKWNDPYPSFPGSSFCIEQYALGMAIEKVIGQNFEKQVQIIPRYDVFVEGQANLDAIVAALTSNPASLHANTTIQGGSSSTQSTGISSISINGTQGIATSSYGIASSYGVASSAGAFAFSFAFGLETAASSSAQNIIASSSYAFGSSYGIGLGSPTDRIVLDNLAGLVLHYYSINFERLK